MKHNIELDGNTVESILRTELAWSLAGLEQDLVLRIEDKGVPIFSNDKEEDVRKIQQMIDALKLVIDYYSVPEGNE